MGATNFNGPLFVQGDMDNLENSPGGVNLLPSPNPDHGPSVFFNGYGIPDPRYTFLADQVQGYTGRVPGLLTRSIIEEVITIPMAHQAAGIAAAAHVVSGTAMTLISSPAAGFTLNIPIIPFSGNLNGSSPVTTAIALDWGFDFGTVTSGSTTVVVLDSTKYIVGMPLVLAGVGAASGNIPLLTNVLSITDSTHIVLNNTPLASLNPCAIGTGNTWGFSEFGWPVPQAYSPFLAQGPGLFLDPRQSLSRGIAIVCNNASGTGGTITVSGYDVYGQAMTEAIATVPATATTTYGKKAFKYIASVVPGFTDATYTYSVGTSDEFGFAQRMDDATDTTVWWNSLLNTAKTGFTIGVTTSPATSSTGDVRGTVLTSAIGNGSGIGATASNGTISALALSGVQLRIDHGVSNFQQTNASFANPQFLFGVPQA